ASMALAPRGRAPPLRAAGSSHSGVESTIEKNPENSMAGVGRIGTPGAARGDSRSDPGSARSGSTGLKAGRWRRSNDHLQARPSTDGAIGKIHMEGCTVFH